MQNAVIQGKPRSAKVQARVPEEIERRWQVAAGMRGQGLGARLLANSVIRSTYNVSAWALMIVDTKDDTACSFYKKNGFESLLDDERHLYISRQDLEARFLRSKP